jgi:hypothetical protein
MAFGQTLLPLLLESARGAVSQTMHAPLSCDVPPPESPPLFRTRRSIEVGLEASDMTSQPVESDVDTGILFIQDFPGRGGRHSLKENNQVNHYKTLNKDGVHFVVWHNSKLTFFTHPLVHEAMQIEGRLEGVGSLDFSCESYPSDRELHGLASGCAEKAGRQHSISIELWMLYLLLPSRGQF